MDVGRVSYSCKLNFIMRLRMSNGINIVVEDTPFAKGGEGAVHKILSPSNYSNLCAKLYFPKERNLSRRNKIEFMVRNPPPNLISKNHIICWAKEVLFDRNRFVGFMMPLAFNGSIQLYELCTPKLRTKLGVSWSSKFDRNTNKGIQSRLKLCTNLSAAIHSIHSLKNYVLVDLKPQNVLVTDSGKVSIIDCDSIQISSNGRVVFPARVATPEYVPPEGANINPVKNVVPQSWDRFSMAIMFYEVIFGLHPYAASFSGRYQNSDTLDSKIKSGLFVHGKKRKHISVLPPLHKNFGIIPNNLKQLFVRAFDTGHQMPDVRPTAKEWGKTIFKELKQKQLTYKPITQHKPIKLIPQRQSPPKKRVTNLPKPQKEGIGGWCILYGLFPIIGIIMMIVYYAQGKNKKGGQALASWIVGIIIGLILVGG